MKFHIEVPLHVSKEEFWKFRSHPDFLRLQVEKGHLDRLETVDEGTLEDGTCFRKMHIFPKMEVFEGFKSLKQYVEEHFTGLEDYQWWKEDGSYTQFFCTKPLGLLTDKVTTQGRMDLIGTGNETCTYILQGTVEVHLVGIGHLAEPIIIRNMKHFYQGKFCELANEFFRQKNELTSHQQELPWANKGPSMLRLGNIFRRKSSTNPKVDSKLLTSTKVFNDKEEDEEESHSQEDEIKVFA
ncbi:hypothetical protein GpartN1_g4863.t1 [Galdieria partita]|uniref:Uncharacterized protein n=1 Tax=Galdieria partita TaxID=83374 RepID=A0A9C7UP32_9RHOD|nr:hypothetical protein GpartN1_g1896.t1 [Galdieria partita]GJQ13072.1 hypothetical protein GpartN1_g4863.t1 [Galdieria partita]